jgi:adenosylmethionine---8-amino-7-oxononanoate aminotransferase
MTPRQNDALAERDKRVIWHPFTQMADWQADRPLVIDHAEGNTLFDADGRPYLDGVSSLWVTVHGHRHPHIDAAVRAQLDRVAHTTFLGLSNVPAIELAERLLAVVPRGMGKVFYSDNGSTAVEVALKMAFQYWSHRGRPEKRRFVALREAYHGDTIGAVSLGGIDLFHEIFHPLLFDALRVPTPYAFRTPDAPTPESCRDHCLQALARTLETHGHEIAAFVIEPLVQGAAGMITHPTGYLREAAALCRKHDVLLIADEVATGFGRTGTLFACEQEGVTPDLLCIAKGLTGGYLPLAATVTTDAVYEAFLGPYAARKTLFHGHTYTANPLACAAAIASLELFEREATLPKLQPKIAALTDLLEHRVAPLAHVGEIRQRGMMVGIELVRDRAARTDYDFVEAIGARACRVAREHGVILRPLGPVVVLMPPLSITLPQLEQIVDAARAGIVAATE